MNIAARIGKIEQNIAIKNKPAEELILLTEINGKFYQEKDGIKIEVPKPVDTLEKNIVIFRSYSDYEMQKDIKQ